MALPSSPPVAVWNFTLKQGADTSISMTWLQSDGVTPLNLTGYSMKLAIKASASSPTALLTLTSAANTGSRIVLGGTAGTINLIFARADTAALVASGLPNVNLIGTPLYQVGAYDLQYTDNAGNVNYLLEGTVSLDPQITV
ncbi:hypothetical protein R69746_07749 [Paraburkholderia aspalathi]|uniref:hypothetical protein n=1 Tax=Paraburkholderia aspalathi TaxID=1324617 RepID=UPI00190AECC1|nr:hypothetical protein [Paraburkholderia aspalathi]MBK3843733.1 hypothetical protein [Paraburkholderia aspalathi]CAE6859629.1 hypothetical protein R69746_07749 [Paraburkholderia aspalathi]